jgi:hypothetical protein
MLRPILGVLLGAMAVLPAIALPAAEVTTFDGAKLSGDVVFDAKGKTLTIGDSTLALADIDTVRLTDGAPEQVSGPIGVWLMDGSWLPATELSAVDGEKLAIQSPLCSDENVSIELDPTKVRGWGEIDSLYPAPRKDAVLVESGALQGTVQGFSGDTLTFKLDDDQVLDLPFAAIKALRFNWPEKPVTSLRLSVTLDGRHPPLSLAPTLPPTLSVAATAPLKLPNGAVLRVEGGRRVYLSDLEVKAEETGAFGVRWPHTKDRSLDLSPLRLGGIYYAKGLVVHSKAELTWKLDKKFERMHALAGISDVTAGEGDCEVVIRGDGAELWQAKSVKGRDKPVALDLELTGVDTLVLTVECGARYDIGDHFTLADAYVVKAK